MKRGWRHRATHSLIAAALLVDTSFLAATAHAQDVTTLAGSGASGSADGTGSAASFNLPFGVAVDGGGNVYVADFMNHKIRMVTPGGAVTTFAGTGVPGSTDGPASTASFNGPFGVALDGAGNVYVADKGNSKIRKITPGGVVTTFAGSGVPGHADGTGTAASFYQPNGVAVDGGGNVYVGDTVNQKIRKVTPGGVVTTLAGSGSPGSADGTGTAASFYFPEGVAVDQGGNVYVGDYLNCKIRKITPEGVVTTLAGSGSGGGSDGAGTIAKFNGPSGVAVDGRGNVYVADNGNSKIRKITPRGFVTTLAGSNQPGSADGIGTAASFNRPFGVAVDGSGTVYVADTYGNKIRTITQSGNETCVPDVDAACLIGGRYKVTSHWQNQYDGGKVSTLNVTQRTDALAAFWLTDPNTYEYLIRINTATDNGKVWISIPMFTDVEFWVAVTDTVSGQYFEYHSPAGNRDLIYDPSYFDQPGGVAGPDPTAVRLDGSTFAQTSNPHCTICLGGGYSISWGGGTGEFTVNQITNRGTLPSGPMELSLVLTTSPPVWGVPFTYYPWTDTVPLGSLAPGASYENVKSGTIAFHDSTIPPGKYYGLFYLRNLTTSGWSDADWSTPEDFYCYSGHCSSSPPCMEFGYTMCLVGGRYRVSSYWKNQYAGGQTSDLRKTTLTDATGAFWLTDSDSIEYLIRINTATDNGKAWIAIATFTDVEFFVTVTDAFTGQSKTYHSAPGNRTLIYDPLFFVYP
jgi:sugar lactone lactonase YvrE